MYGEDSPCGKEEFKVIGKMLLDALFVEMETGVGDRILFPGLPKFVLKNRDLRYSIKRLIKLVRAGDDSRRDELKMLCIRRNKLAISMNESRARKLARMEKKKLNAI
jgi:hypothetical protein